MSSFRATTVILAYDIDMRSRGIGPFVWVFLRFFELKVKIIYL